MTTEPNKEFLGGDTPSIKLGDKEWPIPRLRPRQQQYVVPGILQLGPLIDKFKDVRGHDDAVLKALGNIDTKTFQNIMDVVFHALKRAHPKLTRDEFEEMECTPFELFTSLIVIAKQSGLLDIKAAKSPIDEEQGSEGGLPTFPLA